jgi:hypothetical protein
MTQHEYDEVALALRLKAEEIADAKRPGYTLGSEDVLANFKNTGDRLDITAMQAWGAHFLKHIDALTTLAKNPELPQAEAVQGRFADAMNYLALGYALHVERMATT